MIWLPAVFTNRDPETKPRVFSAASKYAATPEAQTANLVFDAVNCSVFVDGIRHIDSSRIDSRASSDEENNAIMSITISSVSESNTKRKRNTIDRPASLSFFQRAARWWKKQTRRRNDRKGALFRASQKYAQKEAHLPCVVSRELGGRNRLFYSHWLTLFYLLWANDSRLGVRGLGFVWRKAACSTAGGNCSQ